MSIFLRPVFALVLLALPLVAVAVVEAPDHVIYGNVTVFGAPATFGTVVEARAQPGGAVVSRYELGSDTRLGAQFALRIRMDTVDPRRDGYSRPGDPLRVYVGGQLAADTSVGAEGVAVRLDLDPQNTGTGPSVLVENVSQFEGQTQPALINFPVSMNTTSTEVVTINWVTANGSAVGGVACQAGVDYVTDQGAATVAAGALTTTIPVMICGDGAMEPDESFRVDLAVVNGVLAQDSVTGTILDDDNVPVLTIAAARTAEPAAGSAPLAFIASLSRSSPVEVRFAYATQNVEAVAASDYLATSGTAVIAAGALQTVVNVPVLADGTVEPPERLRLNLSSPEHVALGQAFVMGTIDDPQYDPLVQHQDDVEGGAGGVTPLAQPSAIVLTADGLHAYVASESGDAVLHFQRAGSGDLVFVRDYTAASAGFASARLDGARDLALSADDRHLYVAAAAGNGITVLGRDAGTGELSFVQAAFDQQVDASAAGGTVLGLQGPTALTLSPDGSHVYVVAATSQSLVSFARNGTSGVLSFLEAEVNANDDATDPGPAPVALDRPSDVLVSPDGAHVYVAARFGNAVLSFNRDAASGRVSFVSAHRDGQLGIEGLGGAHGLAFDSTGSHLYVASESDNAVVLFDRAASGVLTRREQWTKGDSGLPALGGAQAIRVSPDGEEVYVASFADSSLTAFSRSTEATATVDSPVGDLVPRQTVIDGDGGVQHLAGPVALALSEDGRHVYVAAYTDNAIVRFLRLSADDTLFSSGFE